MVTLSLVDDAARERLIQLLTGLRDRLARADLNLDVVDIQVARWARRELVDQIDDYLVPRLRALDAPLLAVIGGSTGAGKSTLVNSIVGGEVSAAGVIRPTTRSPVLVCHPDEEEWFLGDRVLPGLPRTRGRRPAAGSLHLVADPDVPEGLALLDAPDIDSVVIENRELAAQLLAAADLWLFVTTAARYADAVPWDLLRLAQARTTALAVVLNRVPEEALDDVPQHLEEMLDAAGLDEAPVFTIAEVDLNRDLIPRSELAPLATWLEELAGDAEERAEVVWKTLEGTLGSLDYRVGLVASALDAQIVAARELEGVVDAAFARARADVEDALSGGALLRGEVLARWHEFVGTGDLMRALEDRIGWLRDRLREALSGRPPVEQQVQAAVSDNLQAVVTDAADAAAERAAASWRADAAGRQLVERVPARSTGDLAGAVGTEVRAWQGRVLDLVRAEGASKRSLGRFLSMGVNAVGVALMVAVFAHSGGLTGGEVAIAGGTATVSQKLLEALFGDQAVRDLTARARRDLLDRVGRVVDEEAMRFKRVVDEATPSTADADGLRDAVRELNTAWA